MRIWKLVNPLKTQLTASKPLKTQQGYLKTLAPNRYRPSNPSAEQGPSDAVF
jgi:hypothetical protein